MRKEFRLSKMVEWMEEEGYNAERIKGQLKNFDWQYECFGKTIDETQWSISEEWTVEVEEETKELTVQEISDLLGYDVKVVK
jgi:hypothetical protein